MNLDLNCDLGEGEALGRTRSLMRHVTSVNIACGGHAGDAFSMERCILLAKQLGVRIGAHPGLPGNFGRGEVDITTAQLQTLLLHQLGGFHRLTQVHGIRLHHVKLHGSLYHAVEENPALATTYLTTVGNWFAGLPVYALAGGRVSSLGKQYGVTVWDEFFADRNYDDDGTLVSRTESCAVIGNPKIVFERLIEFRRSSRVQTISGKWLTLRARTVCVHSDSPKAVALAKAAARALRNFRRY